MPDCIKIIDEYVYKSDNSGTMQYYNYLKYVELAME